jgi:hypothetical protein
MPIYPVLLLLVILAGARQPSMSAGTPARAAALAAGALLVLFPLHTLPEARAEVSQRWQHDREVVGQALAPLRRDGLSMIVDQSGAVPLYSGWQATDVLGLNDERIARTGLTPSYLRSLDPDLVMFLLHTNKPRRSWSTNHRALFDFLRQERYLAATAIVKTDEHLRSVRPPQIHFYFVKRSSARAAEVVRTLRGAAAVRRLPARQAARLLERLP